MLHRAILVGCLALALASVLMTTMVASVQADATYRTERLALASIGGAPLRSGAVVNIHTNGPRIYALERYLLNGALPRTTYSVHLTGYTSLTCSGDPLLTIQTAELTTNAAGNGMARALFRPADVAGLPKTTYGIRWTVMHDGTPVAETRCTQVTLD